jgi:hypothetical protein
MKSPLSYLPVVSGFLVLVLSLAVGVLTVTSNKTGSQQITTKAAENTATLALSPLTGEYTYSAGTSYTVGIIINSMGKAIDGTDVVISFDPKKAKVLDTSVSASNLFENTPTNVVDNAAGKIKFSGLTFTPKPVAGIIGTFRFQPTGVGTVTFNFDFSPGVTTDSNIADSTTAKISWEKLRTRHFLLNEKNTVHFISVSVFNAR